MRDVPNPDEYDIHTEEIRFNEVLVVEYPNSIMEIHLELYGIYANIDRERRENDFSEWDECTNCNENIKHRETDLNLCQDCWEASLQAAENYAADNADDLLGDNIN